ncbi:MAG TPA: glycoside hydrolase family 88 protein [Candidatus Limiplasma sp.]|nr:glycoside hydrolase family 88 protein [Candidatus Limiplasma sp.]
MKLNVTRKQLPAAMDAVVRKTMEMDLPWDWPCGVAYYGVARAFETTGKQEYLSLLKARVDELIALGLPAWTVNTCAMGHCLLSLYSATGEDLYLQTAASKIDYLSNHALRFGDRVLQHTVSVNNDFPEQAWADTLFMAAYFMLRYGVLTKDKTLIDDALNQYYWHIVYLQDKATGLWYHGYNNINKDHMSGFYWARANAWAAYTMAQVKWTLPEPYLYPPFMDIECSVRDQLTGLKKLQTEDGLWRTVLDDTESYEELSASCGIAAAMVKNGNPLHTSYVEKAYDAILGSISPDGRVLHVSGGTAVMNDLDGYRKISRTWTQGWGQGLALAFLAAINQTEE